MLRDLRLACGIAAVLILPAVAAPEELDTRVLTQRQQAQLVRQWIEKRFDTLLPALMRREGIDMWVVVSREYNEDPVFRSMVSPTTYASNDAGTPCRVIAFPACFRETRAPMSRRPPEKRNE